MQGSREVGLDRFLQPLASACCHAYRLIAVLWCYLDDSGTDRTTPTVAMAGYVATLGYWRGFERASDRLFRRHGVGLFRGKDFHDGKGDFKGWSSPKQLGFIQGWFDIAQEHVLAGVTLSMVRGAYEGFKKQSGKLQNRSAYGHCFDELLNSLLSDDVVGPQILDDGLSLFVESGANGNDGVLSIFNKRKANDGAPFLEQLSFIDKRACRAIQLADFLAFYSRRHGAAHLKGQRMSPFLELAKDKVRIIAQLGEHFRDVPLKVSS